MYFITRGRTNCSTATYSYGKDAANTTLSNMTLTIWGYLK